MSNTQKYSVTILAEAITVAIAIGFVVSLIYDYGFSYALDLSLLQLPTTVTDHFRSGVLWFPPLIGLVLFYFAVEYQFQRVERGLTEDEIVEGSKAPEKIRKFREGPYKLLTWAMLLALVNFLVIGDTLSAILPVALSILWLKFAEWCQSAPLIQLRRPMEVRTAFTLIPVAVICAFFFGYNAAVNAALREPKFVNIRMESGNEYVNTRLLRYFDTGLLLMSEEGQISFIPIENIVEIRNTEEYRPFRGILCEVFRHCAGEASTSNKAVQPHASD